MSRLFLSADYHMGHANIIVYANRPFKNLDHMNSELVRRYNERIKPNDTFIHAGDFCFRNSPNGKKGEGDTKKSDSYKSQLNGEKVFLRGNHDSNNSVNTHIINLIIFFNNTYINVVHNPEHFNIDYELNLVGHIHNAWKHKRIQLDFKETWLINVGCDVWNYYPVSIDEIFKYYQKLKNGKIT